MVGVNGEISSNAFLHLLLLVAHHVAEVAGPVEVRVRSDNFGILVLVAVDEGAEVGKLGEQIHGILIVVLPIGGLVGSVLVGLEEVRVLLEVEQAHRQNGHGVELPGQVKDKLLGRLIQPTSVFPLVGKALELVFVGISASEEQVEHGLGEWLFPSWSLLSFAAELGDGVAAEGDAVDGVEGAAVVEHDGQSSHS